MTKRKNKIQRESIKSIFEIFVDYLLPELTPYETTLYFYLLCNSFIKNNSIEIRVGKRTIASGYGKGARGGKTDYGHVSRILKELEKKGCIKIGDATREGTVYTIILPKDVPLVAEKISHFTPNASEEDYFTDANKRREIFERDKWICQYCGEKVILKNATLDHIIPQSKGGKSIKSNLKTCCFICNSIKSGKTYEEAAPFLLKSIQERKAKTHS